MHRHFEPRRLFFWAIGCCIVSGTLGGLAQAATSKLTPETTVPRTPHYQGAFWSLQAHSGVRIRAVSGVVLPTAGASFRLSSILSLADLELAFGASRDRVKGASGDTVLTQLGGDFMVHLHPFFMRILKNTRTAYWIAGLHITLGLSCEWTEVGRDTLREEHVDWGGLLGLGTDIPITDPNKTGSFWIGLSYRYRFLSVETSLVPNENMNTHALLVTLSYRNSNIFGARIPRPTEFDYRGRK